jgi:hypothetical protein
MRSFRWPLLVAASLSALAPRPAAALFHISIIDEVMASYDGDADVQFVEIEVLSGGQGFVRNTVLAVFDANGVYQEDLLILPSNLPIADLGTNWLMGTTAFETASGLQADFEFDPGLPLGGGMVCWGAPGVIPPLDTGWDRTDFTNYVDCLAYGSYSGPTNFHIGDPTPLLPEGHSLRRVSETNDNASDFACADPADPTNDAGQSASLAATVPCPEPGGPLLALVGGGVLLAAGRRRSATPTSG